MNYTVFRRRITHYDCWQFFAVPTAILVFIIGMVNFVVVFTSSTAPTFLQLMGFTLIPIGLLGIIFTYVRLREAERDWSDAITGKKENT